MKLRDIHIYGYGKMEDAKFNTMEDVLVFYGENESGKSTIMSFIHSILFGFPTKAQTEQRYEPRNTVKYGGKLTVESKRYGLVSVERVKGKATGDVTVTFPDGTTGYEDDLQLIVQGIDKTYVQSVFSFDLNGLQGLDGLDERSISKYLLSAGMIGSDKLMDAETRIQKELDARFKPSGQKPRLNIIAKELQHSHQLLKKADENQKGYDSLQQKRLQKEKQLAELKSHISEIEKQLLLYKEFLRIKPLDEEYTVLQARILEIGEWSFPEAGVKRLEAAEQLFLSVKSQLTSQQQRTEELKGIVKEVEVNSFIIENKEKIQTTLENGALLEKMDYEQWRLLHSLDSARKEIALLKGDIGINLDEADILLLDTSSFLKERVGQLEKQKDRLEADKFHLDEIYKKQKGMLERCESRIKDLSKRLLPAEKKNELEKSIASMEGTNQTEMRKLLLDEQISELKRRVQRHKEKIKQKNKRENRIFYSFLFLLTLLAVYGAVQHQLLLSAAAVLAALILGGFSFYTKQDDQQNELTEQLKEAERKKGELDRIRPAGESEMKAVHELLEQDAEIERQLASENQKYREYEEAFHFSIDAYSEWEKQVNQNEEMIDAIVKEWGISEHTVVSNAGIAFEKIVMLKKMIEEKNTSEEEYKLLNLEFSSRVQDVHSLATHCGLADLSWKEAITELRKAMNISLENKLKRNQMREELARFDSEILDLSISYEQTEIEIQKLFELANAKDGEEFREKARLAAERERLQEKAGLIAIQLQHVSLARHERQELIEKGISEYTIEELDRNRLQLVDQLSAHRDELASLKLEIGRLEEGGAFDELSHLFHEKKAAFREEAKDWAKFAIAKALLQQTIHKFTEERLPVVLEKAEEFLSFLTDGRYRKIVLGKDQQIQLERGDGIRFGASEVSRGTAEQVYASIRMALANQSFEADPFPIIIDDSFVNFDFTRTERMISLLEKLSETRQVIFFTCHSHLLSSFSKAKLIELKKEEKQVL
ncbi:hypothetical protein D0469_18735 [Peribacillus saganii]|uniref:YhaN AAA domain-containing protein n=1 Tax=Peribacillus saganii TaxID=2303992 RepID=A0A372LEJ1_9BACI|nr:AAA family ATPase [Peribacillus saganii]RFU64408.1 hypothetical protein D0469_18735 [Peribacillus saganii]